MILPRIGNTYSKTCSYLCNDILGNAVEAKNGKLALEAVDRIAKLGGLYNQTQTQVNILGKGDMVIDFKLDDEGDTKQIENK